MQNIYRMSNKQTEQFNTKIVKMNNSGMCEYVHGQLYFYTTPFNIIDFVNNAIMQQQQIIIFFFSNH